MKTRITVVLIEDSPEYRESIALVLGMERDIELVGQFGTVEQAILSFQTLSDPDAPDIILLDLNLPGMSGIEALPLIRKTLPKAKVIVLTQSNREADVIATISAGASGYLLKGSTRSQLAEGIRTVMEGGASLDPQVAIYILNVLQVNPSLKPTVESDLSKREIEILVLLGDGLLKKEIADNLNISPHTVANHIRHIYEKLDVQNAPAAITKAFSLGILR